MKSEWVETEIAKARKREMKDRKRVLFPVRLVGFEALRDWECFDADTGAPGHIAEQSILRVRSQAVILTPAGWNTVTFITKASLRRSTTLS